MFRKSYVLKTFDLIKLHLARLNKMPLAEVKILCDVEGVDNRKNTVAYVEPVNSLPHLDIPQQPPGDFRGNVVYFPGDIQGFTSDMTRNLACQDFVDWSYETTLRILAKRFPFSCVWLIAPSKKAYSSICIYKNFVKSESLMGIPTHSKEFNGLLHLESILCAAMANIDNANLNEYTKHDAPIITVGFSKGCVVLNQFLYEMSCYHLHEESARSVEETHPNSSLHFIKRIQAMVWLDGGHSGEKDVWVTNPSVISNIASFFKLKFYIYVTPYNTQDEHRPWKGEAEAEFVKLLREYKVDFEEKLYFENEPPTIDTHFKILLNF